MNYCQKFIGHLKTICKHRAYVFYYSCKAGIPLQGLVHDLSKFSPIEFLEGVKYYQGTSSPINACKKKNGWSKAWMHHKGRNRHHYEYWIDNLDKGTGTPLEMPIKYAIEMICDFLAAGRAYNGKNFTYKDEYNWWQNKKAVGPAINSDTIKFLDKFFDTLIIDEHRAFQILKAAKILAK
jgi:hypothetical protein